MAREMGSQEKIISFHVLLQTEPYFIDFHVFSAIASFVHASYAHITGARYVSCTSTPFISSQDMLQCTLPKTTHQHHDKLRRSKHEQVGFSIRVHFHFSFLFEATLQRPLGAQRLDDGSFE
jgi:hypothetical protein